jgi:peptidoglycan/LPS O-acetylase OafA/YrhL
VSSHKRYIPTLDGWRALAVIGVILFHGRIGFFHEYGLGARLAARGGLGVDIFFAISGFLICGLLLDELAKSDRINLGRFYVRRAFRILPPYYAALAGICLAGLFAAVPVNYSNLPSCLLFYRNYTPVGIDYHGGYFTAHFWSLAVEEHFYLLFPLFLLLLKPKRAGKVAVGLAVVVFAWRQIFPTLHPGVSYLTHTDIKIDGLIWGCVAAIYFPAIKRFCERLHFSQLWLPIGLAVVVAEGLHSSALMSMSVVLLPALVLSTVIQPNSMLGRVLECKPLRWIGSLSYSLYLWQMLFLPVPEMRAPGLFGRLQTWPFNVMAICLCALASRYLLEIPMTRLGHRLTAPTVPVEQPSVPWWLPQRPGVAETLPFTPMAASVQAEPAAMFQKGA